MAHAAAISAEIAAFLDGTAATCRLWAEQDEGPYHRDHHPDRRDVTESCPGVPLALGLRLASVGGTGLAGAVVEIWHCDAAGRYSGFPPPSTGAAPTADAAPRTEYLAGQMYLRGSQATDQAGRVEFRTIYPGWYPGRTVHIHVIARVHDAAFTSQLYFPEALTDAVFSQPPYSERPGRDTANATDSIFATGGGPAVLDTAPNANGYLAAISLRLPDIGP